MESSFLGVWKEASDLKGQIIICDGCPDAAYSTPQLGEKYAEKASQNYGFLFGGPYNQDNNILGFILGSLEGKNHIGSFNS